MPAYTVRVSFECPERMCQYTNTRLATVTAADPKAAGRRAVQQIRLNLLECSECKRPMDESVQHRIVSAKA